MITDVSIRRQIDPCKAYSVSEVCALLGITDRTLRNYKAQGVLKPTSKKGRPKYKGIDLITVISKADALRLGGMTERKRRREQAELEEAERQMYAQSIKTVHDMTPEQRTNYYKMQENNKETKENDKNTCTFQ